MIMLHPADLIKVDFYWTDSAQHLQIFNSKINHRVFLIVKNIFNVQYHLAKISYKLNTFVNGKVFCNKKTVHQWFGNSYTQFFISIEKEGCSQKVIEQALRFFETGKIEHVYPHELESLYQFAKHHEIDLLNNCLMYTLEKKFGCYEKEIEFSEIKHRLNKFLQLELAALQQKPSEIFKILKTLPFENSYLIVANIKSMLCHLSIHKFEYLFTAIIENTSKSYSFVDELNEVKNYLPSIIQYYCSVLTEQELRKAIKQVNHLKLKVHLICCLDQLSERIEWVTKIPIGPEQNDLIEIGIIKELVDQNCFRLAEHWNTQINNQDYWELLINDYLELNQINDAKRVVTYIENELVRDDCCYQIEIKEAHLTRENHLIDCFQSVSKNYLIPFLEAYRLQQAPPQISAFNCNLFDAAIECFENHFNSNLFTKVEVLAVIQACIRYAAQSLNEIHFRSLNIKEATDQHHLNNLLLYLKQAFSPYIQSEYLQNLLGKEICLFEDVYLKREMIIHLQFYYDRAMEKFI